MGTAVVSLLSVALLLTLVAIFAQSSFRSVSILTDSWQQTEDRYTARLNTQISVVAVKTDAPPLVDITVRNSGQVPIREFEAWDLIVQYYETDNTYHQLWLPYTSTEPPGNNQWTVEGIYLDASASTPEVFQPNILDPAEEVIIRFKLAPAADVTANHQVIIGTPNGVSVSAPF